MRKYCPSDHHRVLSLASYLHKPCKRVGEQANEFLGQLIVLKQDIINAYAQLNVLEPR